MVSRCANPACDARFKYLSEGRLFQFPAPDSDGGSVNAPIELWWLCSRCSLSMTLTQDNARRVKLVPLGFAPRLSLRRDLDRTGS